MCIFLLFFSRSTCLLQQSPKQTENKEKHRNALESKQNQFTCSLMRMLISERFPGSAWFNSKTVIRNFFHISPNSVQDHVHNGICTAQSRKWEHQNEGSIRGISCCLFVRVCWSQKTGKGNSFWVVSRWFKSQDRPAKNYMNVTCGPFTRSFWGQNLEL